MRVTRAGCLPRSLVRYEQLRILREYSSGLGRDQEVEPAFCRDKSRFWVGAKRGQRGSTHLNGGGPDT